MFSWASSQFEKLSLAVAPPPTDPVSRFVFLMQKQSEEEALQCIMEVPDILHMVVNPTKGSYAIHLACQNSMMRLTQHILAQTNNIHVTDGTGNTALHYAALSQRTDQAVAVCRMLVTDFGASLLTKNAMGQTPYDVATLTSVRQYLLPLQLQLETQQALDNGGVGLPPGIDLGGLRIQQNMATVGPPPPTSFGSGGASVSGPPYGMTATATPTAAPGAGGPPHMFATPNPMSPPPVNYQPQGYQTIAPAPATMPAPSVLQHYPAPTSQGSSATTTPAATTENDTPGTNRRYARTGSSSAALDSISGRVRPDGFHSSSSDVNLQKKYGHVSVTRAVPPPPTSGNAGPLNAGSGVAVPGGANPFSAGGAVLSGGVHRYAGGSALPHGSRRYPVYDAVSRSASSSAAPHSAPLASVASSMPNFSVFTPGSPVPVAATNNSSWSQPQQQQAQPQEYAAAAATQQQQPYAAAPLSGSAAASQWQQQQPSWQAGYYSQPNTASTWQSNPNLYEEASMGAPVVEQQPQQQSWQVGYDYGASQGVSQPSVGVSQDLPTAQSPFQQPPPQAAAAADVFFAPPPQAATTTTTTTATQSWGGLFNKGAQESDSSQAPAADVVVASQPEFPAQGVEQQSNSASDATAYVDPASYGTESMSQMATVISAASTIPSTTAGVPPQRPEPVSLIGSFNAEVRTVSGSSSVAEDFFSASGPVSSSTTATSVAAPALVTRQPIAKAPGSWGISPAASIALNGGHVAAGDFFSSPPAPQQPEQQAPTPPIQETAPAVDPVPAEAAAEEQFPAAPVSTAETTPTATTTNLPTSQEAEEASTFAISNCGPFSEPNATAPLNAAALFSQGLSQQPAATAASLFDRQPEPTTTAASPQDAATLFSQGTSLVAATTTATSLFDRPPSSSSQPVAFSGVTDPKPNAAALFSQGPSQQPTASSLFGQPPAKLNETFGLSGLGGAEAFEATTKTSAPELFANGPTAEPSVNTEATPTDDELSDAMHNSVLGDDELFDVALSPGSAKKAVVVLETEASAPASTAPTATPAATIPQFNGAESLFAAIGLPPPPFSSKR